MKLFGYEFIVRKIGSEDRPLFDVARVTINPGDRVVLTTPGAVSMDTAHRLMEQWDKFYPETKAIVVGDGLKLNVLGPSDRAAH